ncbi:MAG: SufD family Fe-S cluster assembly protein [Pseudomonadota bacterium]
MGDIAVTEPATVLSNSERETLMDVGFDDVGTRAATGVLADSTMKLAQSNDAGVVIMPLAEALRTFDFVQDLMFSLVDPEANSHIRMVAEHMHDPLGHFVWVKPGAKVQLPVQTFTLLETPQGRQFTHDVTLIDEGAEVEMISGAAAPSDVHRGRHISVCETYLRPGAKCRSVSIEHWGAGMEVYAYSYSRMERGAQDQSLSIALAPIDHHESYASCTQLEDTTSVAQSICFAPGGTERVVRTETILAGTGAKSEDLTRMVSAGGRILNDARLIGAAGGTQGFLGCDGLKLGEDGGIVAVPALDARAEGAQLSHEASVGMIDSEKLSYLMASGLSEDAARDLIVQGFLSLDDAAVPSALKSHVTDMIARAKSGGM